MMVQAEMPRLKGYRSLREGFCRKDFAWQKRSLPWTQLCCEGRELLECRDACLRYLALTDHMRGFDPSKRCCRRTERFEAEHRPCDPFDEAMILAEAARGNF